ncbi:MAG: cytochrome c oxidase assembly protein [Solirubrobacterales bacterium]
MAAATPLDWTGGPALAWVLSAALLYWLGGRKLAVPRSDAQHRWRTAAFVGGLGAIVIALDSPVDGLADKLFWVHMLQHILLLLVAPPLLALARPWNRMWRGFPLGTRRVLAQWVSTGRWSAPLRATAGILAKPLPSWLLFNLVLLGWHVPAAYDAALSSPVIHASEHFLFFATGLLFWTRVIDSPPWRSRLSETGRAAYVGSSMVVSWLLAVVLADAGHTLYSPYADLASRPGGLAALADQQLGAGVMWVLGSIPFTIAILSIVYRWLEPKRSGQSSPAVRPLAGNP